MMAPEYTYSQKELARLLKTSPQQGTGRRAFTPVFRRHGYVAAAKINSSIDEIRRLLKQKYRVMVNYREMEEDVGHYAVVVAVKGGRVILHDPWHGASYALPISAFVKRWYGKHRHANTRWIFAAKPRS